MDKKAEAVKRILVVEDELRFQRVQEIMPLSLWDFWRKLLI